MFVSSRLAAAAAATARSSLAAPSSLASVARARSSVISRIASPVFVRAYSSHELDPANKNDYDAYVAQWVNHFSTVEDDFELERGLNHIFAADWAPSVELIAESIKASRRLNTFATAVRILEAVEHKVHNKSQYEAYLRELKPLLDDLGVVDKHALGEIKAVRQKNWWADA
ncbi:Cytochrome c oxidase subunit 6 [Cladochytrium tenue]|nr:Cytochrome c oxidase subunit 6 [Cladochytrium tenue]